MTKASDKYALHVKRQAAKDRKPKKYFVTDKEHVFLTKQLKEFRK